MRRSAGLFESRDFIIKRLPATAEHMRPRDDDIDFVAPASTERRISATRSVERREACRKSSGDRGHPNPGAFQRVSRSLHKSVIDADGRHLRSQFFDAKLLDSSC